MTPTFLIEMFRRRAAEAYSMAEAATDPLDKAAFRAAAQAWEKVAGTGAAWSHQPLRRELTSLTAEVAVAVEAAQLPANAPVPTPETPRLTPSGLRIDPARVRKQLGEIKVRESASIEF